MKVPRRLMCLALLVLALGANAVMADAAPREAIEAFIDDAMPASRVPGLAYAVVDGDDASAGARGVVKLGGDTAVTPDTPFVIGSISKSFTALAVMQLVEAGKIDLDTELAQVLDGFSGRPAGAITIRQLLSHTSGFSTQQGNVRHPDATGEVDDLERAVARLAEVTPAFEPDTTWDYSNANYQILGRVIEVVSGQEYQTYVATHILEPIGMGDSFVADGDVHPSMATGHRPWFGTKRPVADTKTDRVTAPQGGIVASANDLARYLGMMMNGEDDVLSAAGKARMMRPASAVSPNYGFGWNLDPRAGVVWHDGVSPGVETLATMLPAQKTAVVVLVNGGSGMGFGETGHLRVGIADRALGLGYDSGGVGWPRQSLFILLLIMPVFYLLGIIKVWGDRAEVRAKSGAVATFSLWFPLLTTGAAAWVLIGLVPSLFGTSIGSLVDYSPDLALALVASGVGGVLLTGFRIGVAYTGRVRPT